LGNAYGLAGRERGARRVLERLEELRKVNFVNPDYFSVVYLGLGDPDQAREWLYRARETRTDWAGWFPVDPVSFPLHSDARFVELVGSVGIGNVLR
jgi:hypothetical protein